MKVESESEVTQSYPTPSDLMDCSLPRSSVHGIFRATVLEWGAIAFSQNKLQGYIIQHGEYSQHCIITINGVESLKIVNHYIVHLKLI